MLETKWSTRTLTERRVRVVKNPASFSEGSGFKSRPGERMFRLRSFVVYSQSLQANAWIVSYNWATTDSFQIPSNSSFTYHNFIRRYIVWVLWKASLNKLQIRNTYIEKDSWMPAETLICLLSLLSIKYQSNKVSSLKTNTIQCSQTGLDCRCVTSVFVL
jgi:hypothetical protein